MSSVSVLCTVEGKSAFLDVYQDRAVARTGDYSKTSTISYAKLKSVSLVDDSEAGDRYICFTMAGGKKIRFHVKQDDPSLEQASEVCSSIEKYKEDAIFQGFLKNHRASTTQKVTCPSCHSTNIQALGENRKAFSVGKAVGGWALSGGIGALAGFVGNKKGYDMMCTNCGNRFQIK